MYEHILFDVRDGVATLTLNRPDVLNAYIPQMGEEVVDAYAQARDDDAVRAVILTGAGRGFCAGVDLDFMKKNPPGAQSPPRTAGLDPIHSRISMQLPWPSAFQLQCETRPQPALLP